MLNFELVRAINLDRERDIERALRQHSLRVAAAGPRPVVQPTIGRNEDAPGRASPLIASRLR